MAEKLSHTKVLCGESSAANVGTTAQRCALATGASAADRAELEWADGVDRQKANYYGWSYSPVRNVQDQFNIRVRWRYRQKIG